MLFLCKGECEKHHDHNKVHFKVIFEGQFFQ